MKIISQRTPFRGLFLAAGFFLISNTCYPSWQPYTLIDSSRVKGDNYQQLEDRDYIKLKDYVWQFLKESWCSSEKMNLIMDLIILERPEICVEVGVFSGASFLPIVLTLRHMNHGKAIAVDAWSNEEAIRGLNVDDKTRQWWAQVDIRRIYSSFMELMHSLRLAPYCDVIAKPSHLAILDIQENIDFLHLDGNFSALASVQDVQLYLPKVNKGGYVLISNILYTINETQPRFEGFLEALRSCELVCSIDGNNSVLLRKIQ